MVATGIERLTVIKFGSSVVSGRSALLRIARQVRALIRREPSHRWCLVVSGQRGRASRLVAEARLFAPEVEGRSLSSLQDAEAAHTAALLAIALGGLGVHASVCEPLRAAPPDDPGGMQRYWDELRHGRVVIVPARGQAARDRVGASDADLAAVRLAIALRGRCELVKDVPGFFHADPKQVIGVRQVPRLTTREGLRLAEEGHSCVSPGALRAAEQADVPLLIRGFNPYGPATQVVSATREAAGAREFGALQGCVSA